MDYFPLFLKLQNQPCLVAGAGHAGSGKIRALLEAGANITVVAPDADPVIARLSMQEKLVWHQRSFLPGDLHGARLVIAATDCAETNRHIYRLAERRGILVNAVDDPDNSRFISPAVVDRNPLLVAVSTGGHAPVLSRLVRQQIETRLPAPLGRLALLAGRWRKRVKARLLNSESRRKFWESVLEGTVASHVLNGRTGLAEQEMEIQLQEMTDSRQGEVFLIGAGPGDPELLTLKALRLMQQADVVLFDRLVTDDILCLVRREAERIPVGKRKGACSMTQDRINETLVTLAREGKRVCRLKGGDPFVFGRGGEEVEYLAKRHIPFQVVPGITAASGCAASAGIPLTHRDHADSVVFLTGHRKTDGALSVRFRNLTDPRQTLVFYMGLSHLEEICRALIVHGLDHRTPAAAIQDGTGPRQIVVVATLQDLAGQVADAGLVTPTLIVVGQVAGLARKLHWFGDTPRASLPEREESGASRSSVEKIVRHAEPS